MTNINDSTKNTVMVAIVSGLVSISVALITAYVAIHTNQSQVQKTTREAGELKTRLEAAVVEAEAGMLEMGNAEPIAWELARAWNKAQDDGFVSFYSDSGNSDIYFSVEIQEPARKFGPIFSNSQSAAAITLPVARGSMWRIQVSLDKEATQGVNEAGRVVKVYWTALSQKVKPH